MATWATFGNDLFCESFHVWPAVLESLAFTAGMPWLDTTRLRNDAKTQTRHEEPTVSHITTDPTQQKPADTADTTGQTRL